jgi:hypothetical protein
VTLQGKALRLEEAAQYGGDVMISVQLSVESFVVSHNDQVLGLWGYCPTSYMGLGAQLWCLAGPGAYCRPQAFLKESIRIVDGLLERFPILIATVETDFEKSRRWLEWLGFRHGRQLTPHMDEYYITQETFRWHF